MNSNFGENSNGYFEFRMFRNKIQKPPQDLDYELAFYNAFIEDWKVKKDLLAEEFDRVKAFLAPFASTDFEDSSRTLVWRNNRPSKSALEIADAVMFMVHAEPYLLLRKQQVELNIQKNEDPKVWANIRQKLLHTYETLQSIAPRDTEILIDNLASLSYMTVVTGSHQDLEIFLGPSKNAVAKRKRKQVGH